MSTEPVPFTSPKWQDFLPIIAQYGIPLAFQLWKNITSKEEPTEEAWNALAALAEKRYEGYINEALVAKLGERAPMSALTATAEPPTP